jgi:hypothetical protein
VEKIIWKDRVKKKYYAEARRKGTSYIRTIKRKKANSIGYMLRRNFLLELVVAGKIEGKGR